MTNNPTIINAKPVFCDAAIYTCTCCGYTAEMYSDEEWISEDIATPESLFPPVCVTCGKMHVPFFDPCMLFRDDVIDPEDGYPFHPQPASLPDNKINICKHCLGMDNMRWTEKVMNCRRCDTYTMQFTSYSPGRHMKRFAEYAIRLANVDPAQFDHFQNLNEYGEYEPQKQPSPETRRLFRHLHNLQEQLCDHGSIYSVEALHEDEPLRTYLMLQVANEQQLTGTSLANWLQSTGGLV